MHDCPERQKNNHLHFTERTNGEESIQTMLYMAQCIFEGVS